MCTDMAKKASAKQAEPMKLFYIFYNQERWDNWIKTLEDANFEPAEGEEVSEGEQMLYSFTEDITLSVLKIIRLYQNGRFTKEEATEKLDDVELIVMTGLPGGGTRGYHRVAPALAAGALHRLPEVSRGRV